LRVLLDPQLGKKHNLIRRDFSMIVGTKNKLDFVWLENGTDALHGHDNSLIPPNWAKKKKNKGNLIRHGFLPCSWERK